MKLYIAVFDPSLPLADGSYWARRSAHVPDSVLNEAYYSYLRQSVTSHSGQTPSKPSVFGIAMMPDSWCVYYRIIQAGRDNHGRPGRFAILCAFANRADAYGLNPESVWNALELKETIAAPTIGESTTKNEDADFETDDPVESADPILVERLLSHGTLLWPQSGTWKQFVGLCAKMPSSRNWSIRVARDEETWSATIQHINPATIIENQSASNSEPRRPEHFEPVLAAPEFSRPRLLVVALAWSIIAAVLVAEFGGIAIYFAGQTDPSDQNVISSQSTPVTDRKEQDPAIAGPSTATVSAPVRATLISTSDQTFWTGVGFGFVAGFSVCLLGVVGLAAAGLNRGRQQPLHSKKKEPT